MLNHKGGVGKTTSSVNIGAGLSLKGKRVLLVDLDPQANLTVHFGLPVNGIKNIYGALRGEYLLPIQKYRDNLDIVTSSLDLSASESELMAEAGREYLLKGLLKPVLANYDFIIIDCPPSLGLLTLNALSVSNRIIVPLETSGFGIEGMNKLFEIIDKVKERLNESLNDFQILLTKIDKRKTLHTEIKNSIYKQFSNNTFKTPIHTNVSLEEAVVNGKHIFDYAPTSTGAKEYDLICEEIIIKFN
jgi:chromosome partitioning protein